jgi:hypothetical protein
MIHHPVLFKNILKTGLCPHPQVKGYSIGQIELVLRYQGCQSTPDFVSILERFIFIPIILIGLWL